MENNDVIFYKENNRWLCKVIFSFHADIYIAPQHLTLKLRKLLEEYQTTKTSSLERKILSKVNKILNANKEHYDYTDFHSQSKNLPVYKNGNLLPRENIYRFMLQENNDIDKKISNKFSKEKQKNKHPEIEQVSLAEQLDRNIFSGIVNYIFSDLTNLSIIELNEKRKNNFNQIFALIDEKMSKNDLPDFDKLYYDSKQNSKGIDEVGANKLKEIISGIFNSYKRLTREEKIHFIENWTLTNKGREKILDNGALRKSFNEYSSTHRALFVMKDMAKSETAIENDRPFFGFSELKIPIKNSDGAISEKAKEREHSALETFAPNSQEYQYSPLYDNNLTETIADNYFKLGLVGMYVSNKKTEGFSDLNLHTVITTVPKEADINNDPAKSIQGLGRLRGKDTTQQPLYFNTLDRGLSPAFNLDLLNKEGDYYPQYFESKRQYNHNSIEYIGKEIANDIDAYLQKNKNEYNEINYREFNDGIQLIVLNAFRRIYNNNDHDLELSKNYLKEALNFANSSLQFQQEKLKKAYGLDPFAGFLGALINFAYTITYHFKTKDIKNNFDSLVENYKKENVNSDNKVTTQLYSNIIQSSDFKLLCEKNSTFIEFGELFNQKQKSVERSIKGQILKIFSNQEIQDCNENIKQNILPSLVQYLNPEKQKICLMEAEKFSNWHHIFIVEHKLLTDFGAAETPEKRSEIAIKLFKKVPALHHYLSENEDKFNPIVALFKMQLEKELIPLTAKFFKPEAQKIIIEELTQFKGWDQVFKSMKPEKINSMDKFFIDMVKETKLFNSEFLEDNQRDYEETLEEAASTISNKIKENVTKDIQAKAKNALNAMKSLTNLFRNKKSTAPEKKQEENFLAAYLNKDFLKDIEPLFIQKDLNTIKELFQNKKITRDFSNHLFTQLSSAMRQNQLEPNFFLNSMKQFFEKYDNGIHYKQIEKIISAPERLQNMAKEFEGLKPAKENLDAFVSLFKDTYKKIENDSKEQTIKKEILPILSDPAFKKTILDSVGHLNKEDIKTFVKVVSPEAQEALGNQVYEFISLIKKDKCEELFDRYIKKEAIEEADNLIESIDNPDEKQQTEVPFITILSLVNDMRQQQILAHKYFNSIPPDPGTKGSKLAGKINQPISSCRVPADEVNIVDEFGVFQLEAMRTGMEINSSVRAKINQKHISDLNTVTEFILNPILNTLSIKEAHTLKGKVFSGSRVINTKNDLVDSSKKMAERINHLTPLTAQEVNEGTIYTDAIDFLMKPIVQAPGLSYLTDWWYQRSQPSSSNLRFSD